MEYKKAKDKAVEICYKLQPECNKINIAGSVRRRKPEVKDIEIVCLPKAIEHHDLYGEVAGLYRSLDFARIVNGLGKTVKGKPEGRMMQIDLGDIMLDLFIPEPHDYFRQYAIRTGSSQYSSNVIAYGWKKIGWCGTENGLRKLSECEEKKLPEGKSKWVCKERNPTLPPVWASEEEFFNWLEIPFLAPEKRSM